MPPSKLARLGIGLATLGGLGGALYYWLRQRSLESAGEAAESPIDKIVNAAKSTVSKSIFLTIPRVSELILNGQRKVAPGLSVAHYANGLPSFYNAGKYGKRSLPPRNIVLHDTVGYTASGAYGTLAKKGFSTHFLVEADGTVYQTLDPADKAIHASEWNATSIGIDIVNPLDPKLDGQGRVLRAADWAPKGTYWDLTGLQAKALRGLLTALEQAYSISDVIPRRANGSPAYAKVQETLNIDPNSYNGVIAHAQVNSNRWDGNDALVKLYGGGVA